MADIEMPQLGETVTEGTITKWFKNVGDPIAEDEVLFEVSTDKVDSEVPSPVAGFLAEIRVPEGDTVDVGTVLAVVADAPPAGGAPAPTAETAAEPAAEEAPAPPPPPPPVAAAAPAPPPPPPPPVAAPAAPPPPPEAAPAAPAAARGGGWSRAVAARAPAHRRQRARPGHDPGHRHRGSHHPRRRRAGHRGRPGRALGSGRSGSRSGRLRPLRRRRRGAEPPRPLPGRAPATRSRSSTTSAASPASTW